MNNKPCGECLYFDVIIRGKKETKSGWCSKKSKYPAKEGPGQVFPDGVERVAEGELAQPVIVSKTGVVAQCTLYRIRKGKKSKRKARSTGQRIHGWTRQADGTWTDDSYEVEQPVQPQDYEWDDVDQVAEAMAEADEAIMFGGK